MTKPKEVIYDWLTRVQEEGRGLTKWEQDFIESLSDQFDRTGSLSDRQEQILERIYAEKTPWRPSIFGAPKKDDIDRAEFIDAVVERVFDGPVTRTHVALHGEPYTRIDCSNGSPDTRQINAREHARGHGNGGRS